MIIVYTQAADRQALDVAADGQLVSMTDPAIRELRTSGARLNRRKRAVQVGEARIHRSRRAIRVAVWGNEEDALELSPLVVVAPTTEVVRDPYRAAAAVMRSVQALGRSCDERLVEAGFVEATRAHKSETTTAISLAVAAGIATTAFILTRTRGSVARLIREDPFHGR